MIIEEDSIYKHVYERIHDEVVYEETKDQR